MANNGFIVPRGSPPRKKKKLLILKKKAKPLEIAVSDVGVPVFKPSQVDIGSTLGKGTFGHVQLAQVHMPSGLFYRYLIWPENSH